MDQPFRDSIEAALARAQQAEQAATERARELEAQVVELRDRLASLPTNVSAFTKRVSDENADLRRDLEELRSANQELSRTISTMRRPVGYAPWGSVVEAMERALRRFTKDPPPPPSRK